ncbi:MAG TPA: aspartate 1-decarboxylase [Candidatus Kapabacteria bacterium]|nr:aspartate 1-decarboxylase [Candidatus Kapabacteria bacterium]
MLRNLLKSKLHQATVTQAELYYEGSITIDEDLMEAADIVEFEKVAVVNNNNGERFETYVIKGERGTGIICLNGAAARKAAVGDKIIIMTYCSLENHLVKEHKPLVLVLDENNKIKRTGK